MQVPGRRDSAHANDVLPLVILRKVCGRAYLAFVLPKFSSTQKLLNVKSKLELPLVLLTVHVLTEEEVTLCQT